MKHLVAYNINNQRVGLDLEIWNKDDLDENDPFKYEEPVSGSYSEGYTNAHTPFGIHFFGRRVGLDYISRRWLIRPILNVTTWAGLETDKERLLMIDLYLYENNNPSTGMTDDQWKDSQNQIRVAFLMSYKGLSQDEAESYIHEAFGKHHVLEIECCSTRLDRPAVYRVIAKYLDLNDARNFRDHVRNLFYDYRDEAIFGTEHGSVGIGIIDFIKSTPGTALETAGLESKGYVMQNGDTDMTNFINDLLGVFLEGNQ